MAEFIRNGWAVFFRWPPLSELSAEEKLRLMSKAMNQLYADPNFEAMKQVTAYHPSAVFTATRV